MRDTDASPAPSSTRAVPGSGSDFIRAIVEEDLDEGRYDEVVTRFPPEPNGYLHIGHAKSIVLNFGVAEDFDGRCHLRFDDTNPLTEEEEYADAIARDVRWLGYDWGEHLYHAADYFDRLFEYAERLIRKGKAYVDSQSEEEIREGRGTVTEPGVESPYRDRPPEESLDLFHRMKEGEFEEGAHVLRAKIHMAHPNMLMRDPVLYRIRHAEHYRAGDEWCVYPMYDFAHCLEDTLEGVTHSLCTLEFANNRALYDWILDEVGFEEPRPHQYEFARLNLDYTVLSKRKLIRLVKEDRVGGWDDPRMPTIAGLRRRGVPPEAIRAFCEMIGVARSDSRVDVGKLEYAIRDHLNWTAPRRFAVLEPLRLVVENWPEEKVEWLEAPDFPPDVDEPGTRRVPFSRTLWIERDDFAEDPPSGFRRLAPGRAVRLRHGYIVECTDVVKDPETGRIREVRCRYDPETRGGTAPDGLDVRGTIHWVSAEHALDAEVRLYDRLFLTPDPEEVPEGEDFTRSLNPESLVVKPEAKVEPSLAGGPQGQRVQFERTGYFWRDPVEPGGRLGSDDSPEPDVPAEPSAAAGPTAAAESTDEPDAPAPPLVFNRIVTLRDTWSRRARELKEEAGIEEAKPEADDDGPADDGDAAAPPPPPQTPEDRISDERRAAREADPELARRMERYREGLDLSLEEADILTGSRALSDLFEEALETHDDPPDVAAWITNDVMRELGEREPADLPFDGAALGRLVAMVDGSRINRRAGRRVLAEMVASGADPQAVVERRGLEAVDDPELLSRLVDEALSSRPEKVEEYRDGRTGLLGFFIGRVMEETDGRADPRRVRELLLERLEEDS